MIAIENMAYQNVACKVSKSGKILLTNTGITINKKQTTLIVLLFFIFQGILGGTKTTTKILIKKVRPLISILSS